MDVQDQNDFRRVVAFFWGKNNANNVPMTERAVTSVVSALETAGACSKKMDLVSRPHNSLARPAFAYAIKQITNIAKNLNFGNSGIYISCKNVVAISYRTRIAEIIAGID